MIGLPNVTSYTGENRIKAAADQASRQTEAMVLKSSVIGLPNVISYTEEHRASRQTEAMVCHPQ